MEIFWQSLFLECKVIAELIKKTHWKPWTSSSAFSQWLLKINYNLAYDYGNGCSYMPCKILRGKQKPQAKEPSWTSAEFQAGSSAASWVWRTPHPSAASAPIPSAAQAHRARSKVSKHVSYILEEAWAISKNSSWNLRTVLKHSAWAIWAARFLLLTSFNLSVCKIQWFRTWEITVMIYQFYF